MSIVIKIIIAILVIWAYIMVGAAFAENTVNSNALYNYFKDKNNYFRTKTVMSLCMFWPIYATYYYFGYVKTIAEMLNEYKEEK